MNEKEESNAGHLDAVIGDVMNQIAMLVIQYPQLEGLVRYEFDKYEWHDPFRIRYENYCCIVNNAIIMASLYSEEETLSHKGIQELVILNYKWFTHEDQEQFIDGTVIEQLTWAVKDEADNLKKIQLESLRTKQEDDKTILDVD